MTQAIEVQKVWKRFKIYQDKPTTLKEKILYKSKGVFQEKWVLEDITFSISKGKMIGFIGRNGSGKSTLLKILTKILVPDQGEVSIYGRVSSLLELGAGFHMDFTGRENIYMNASIFGLNRKEIDKILDDIIRFSELESFIDNPVRTYSSGMYMRLAFSIAIHVDPDVLLIDEILAVGDTAFQRKCINKIEDFKRLGKTIVIVSHDNGTMERLCDEIYWIHKAKIRQFGTPREVIRDYLDSLSQEEEVRLQVEEIEEQNKKVVEINDEEIDTKKVENNEETIKRWGNKNVEIKNILLKDGEDKQKQIYQKGSPMIIEIHYDTKKMVDKAAFGFAVFGNDGTFCYGTNTFIDKYDFPMLPNGIMTIRIESLNLTEGKYTLDIACHHIDGTPYDYITNAATFHIHSHENDQGVAFIPHKWEVKESLNE